MVINLVLLVFLSLAVALSDSGDPDSHLTLQQAILIEPNYTGLDCYFNANEECYWTWDADNYTDSESQDTHKPGQNGFIPLDSEDVKRYYNKWPGQFFGPYLDPRNYTGKTFNFYIL